MSLGVVNGRIGEILHVELLKCDLYVGLVLFRCFQAMRNTVMAEFDAMEPAESVASSAVKTAIDLDAAMVVVLTETGTTARLLAKYRPDMPILAFTAAADCARQINGYLRNVQTQVRVGRNLPSFYQVG